MTPQQQSYYDSSYIDVEDVRILPNGDMEFDVYTGGAPDSIEPAMLTRTISVAEFEEYFADRAGYVDITYTNDPEDSEPMLFSTWLGNLQEHNRAHLLELAEMIINSDEKRNHVFSMARYNGEVENGLPDVFQQLAQILKPVKAA